MPPLADGGTISPSVYGVAVAGTASDARVFFGLQNFGPDYSVVAESTILYSDPNLQSIVGSVAPGPQCFNMGSLIASPDGTLVYGVCGGAYLATPNPSSYLSVTDVASGTAKPLIELPLSNPFGLATLRDGRLAIRDNGQARVAFYNPFDGGVSSLDVDCPGYSDGGINPEQYISAVVAAP
jgi:hypothetical protein